MAMNGTRRGRRMESIDKNQPVAEYEGSAGSQIVDLQGLAARLLKAGDRTRTGNIQLGRLTLYH